MKTRPRISITASELLLGVMVLVPVDSIFAQSGRVIPPPRPTPPPTEAIRSEAKSIFTPDPNADKYKLVFALSSEGKRSYTSGEKEALNRALYSQRKNYVELLNKEGALGYQLISSISGVALVKQESVQYEYTWFLTTSGFFFAKQGFETEYATRVKQGFSLVDHLFLSRSCEISPPTPYNELPEVRGDHCEYSDFFILERIKGNESSQKYRLAQHIPRWRELNGEATLTEQLNEDLLRAFYPTHAFSKYEVLSQPTAEQELPVGEKVELRVLTGDLPKKVNEFAQQGYRLAVSNYEIAVMARRKGETRPTSYIWLDATKKDFAKRLAQIQEQGAVYLTTYPDQHGEEKSLIFELPSIGNSTHREYKILKFEIQTTENIAEQKLYSDLTPVSKETLKTLNQLAREGFEARDLFISDEYVFSKNFRLEKVSVLLERSR
jgi:hypothetical protein